jgi:hypothetical protein
LLILHSGRHNMIVGQIFNWSKEIIVLDVTERWFRFNFFYSGTCG